MKLAAAKRTVKTKLETRNIRRQGKVPAIIYSKGEAGEEIVVNGIEFQKILNTLQTGTLSSKIFDLDIEGRAVKAIVKDIQYNVTNYEVIHIDFEQLHAGLPVTLNIPLRCTNTANCLGVKLGGVIRQVVRQVRVTCLPEHIPDEFQVDVKDLNLGQMKKLQDLEIPEGVRPMGKLKGVAVVIARK